MTSFNMRNVANKELLKFSSEQKVGVDANMMLRAAANSVSEREPNWFATSAVPETLGDVLMSYITDLTNAGAKPLVVFDGLPTSYYKPQQRTTSDISWSVLLPSPSTSDLLSLRPQPYFDDEVVNWAFRFLLENSVEVVRAPYLAWSQLASMKAEGVINELVSMAEALLCPGVDRICIYDPDGETKDSKEQEPTMLVYLKERIQEAGEKQSAMPGDTFLAIHAWQVSHKTWRALSHFGGLADDPRNPVLQQEHVIETLRLCPVLKMNGTVAILSEDQPPAGVLEGKFALALHAPSMPPVYYALMASGILSPAILSVVSSAKLMDTELTLDVVERRTMLDRILPLRTQVIFQLMAHIRAAGDIRFSDDHMQLQWNPVWPVSKPAMNYPPQIVLDEWREVENRQHDLLSVLKYQHRAYVDNSSIAKYHSVHAAAGVVQLKLLDLMGYFTHAAQHQEGDELSAPSLFARALEAGGTNHPEAAILLIELSRTKTLSGLPFTEVSRDAEQGTVGLESAGLNLAVRVLSLVHVECRQSWTGAVHPSVLAFLGIVRSFQSTLRSLAEVTAAMLYTTQKVSVPLKEYRQLVNLLPFGTPRNAYAGCIATHMLTDPQYTALESPRDRMDNLKREFRPDGKGVGVVNLEDDLQRMAYFWGGAIAILKSIRMEDETNGVAVDKELQNAIADACVFVSQAFDDIGISIREVEPPQPQQNQQPMAIL